MLIYWFILIIGHRERAFLAYSRHKDRDKFDITTKKVVFLLHIDDLFIKYEYYS